MMERPSARLLDEQKTAVHHEAKCKRPEAALPLLRQLLFEDVEHDHTCEQGTEEVDTEIRNSACGTGHPADEQRSGQQPPTETIVVRLMISVHPAVTNRELEGERERE